jgi:hypothetical protein
MERRMTRSGWRKGWPWCASWAREVWIHAYQQKGASAATLEGISKILGPSAMTTYENAKKSSLVEVNSLPAPGAITIWRHGLIGWTGHAGIVVAWKDEWLDLYAGGPRFNTIEGNTNDAGGREGYIVAMKSRPLDFSKKGGRLNLLGFIHPKEV